MKVVVIEKRPAGGGIRREALELVAQGRKLGNCSVVEFTGPRVSAAAVAVALAPTLRDADLVLVPGSPAGRDVAEHVARVLGRNYIPDVTELASVALPAVASVPLGTFPLTEEPPIPQIIAVDMGRDEPSSRGQPNEVTLPTEDEVLGYFKSLSNWGRWGPDDERGTLNHITPEHRRRAAALVSQGVTVSCAREIDTTPSPFDRYGPPQRFMTSTGQGPPDPDRVPAGPGMRRYYGASEYIGMVFHGNRVTHLDALSHQHWDRRMYNGAASELVHSLHGATRNAVTAAGDGIVTRGVLLDIPALHGKEWLDPATPIHIADLEAAEARQGVRVGQGDALLVHIGYGRRMREHGPLDPYKDGQAGLHAACLPWLHDRSVAVLGSDGGSDLRPSGYAQVMQPSHNIGIFAMGLWLIDHMNLEDLATVATRLRRWEFLFVLAPLRFSGATGSPANPLAVF